MGKPASGSRWTLRAFVPAIAPAVLGVVVGALGHPGRAALLWVVAVVALVLVVAGMPLQRYVERFAMSVAHWVSVFATGVVGLMLVAAGWTARLFRRDPLTPRALRRNEWHPAAGSASARRLASAPFGVESGRHVTGAQHGVRGALRGVVLAFGMVCLVLAADLGLGLSWEALKSEGSPAVADIGGLNLVGDDQTVADPRAGLPAMAAYPWADAYLRELQKTKASFWPYTETRPLDFDGEYVHIHDWARRTYRAPDLPDDAPVVWMFGGSTTFGEGQRDEHTIASYLARLAEKAGAPIDIVNYGQRGWTHFQEMILFEQLLADRPLPDVAIFYDGANEITSQSLDAKGVPTHVLVDQYAELISGGIADEFKVAPEADPSPLRVIWDAYFTHSAVRKVIGRIDDAINPHDGASTGPTTIYHMTLDDARNAVDVYERGRDLTAHLADRYDVDAVFFWQPVMAGLEMQWANEHISGPTINISDALDDHKEVFIDGGHTNEVGAELVAERIWKDLASRVGALY